MNIQIQAVHFDAGEALQQQVSEKLTKLEKIYDRIESAQVTLKKEAGTTNTCVAEVRLLIPDNDLFAKESAATFTQALTQLTADLKKQLVKRKDKLGNFERIKGNSEADITPTLTNEERIATEEIEAETETE